VIPKGRKPAVAGITLARDASVVRKEGECLKVVDVQRGGPGAAAGIKRGDYVLGFDANMLAKLENFGAELRKHVSGDVVTLTVQSGQQASQVKVTLGLGR
jgi:putative serine protease PepD